MSRLPTDPRARTLELSRRTAPHPGVPRMPDPQDEARLAALDERLAKTYAEAEDVSDRVDRFIDDVDSGEIFPNGVILAPVEEEDTLVTRIEEGRRAVRKAAR